MHLASGCSGILLNNSHTILGPLSLRRGLGGDKCRGEHKVKV